MNKHMKKYKNREFHFSGIDIFLVVGIIACSFFAFLFYKDFLKANEKYNIKKTEVTHIIQTPSQEQIIEIKNKQDIGSVVPYYFCSCSLKTNDKSVKTDLYLIENIGDIGKTLFADRLLISKSTNNAENKVYIDKTFASKNKLSVGDKVLFEIGNQQITCIVSAVYKSDGRHDTGMVMAEYSGEMKEKVNPIGMLKYSGAYICSNDEAATNEWLRVYEPLGDLRLPDDFDSEEMYQAYLDMRADTDYTQTTFYKSRYEEDVSKRYGTERNRTFILSVLPLLVEFIFVIIFTMVRTRKYIKSGLIVDIRNNYSVEQEKEMFSAYFNLNSLIACIAAICFSLAECLVIKIENPIIVVACLFLVPIIALLISKSIVLAGLNRDYLENKGCEE